MTRAWRSCGRFTMTGRSEDAAYTSKDEYMFGDEMLVAPVTAAADKASGPGDGEGVAAEWRVDRVADGEAFRRASDGERSFSIDQVPVYLQRRGDCSDAAADALYG